MGLSSTASNSRERASVGTKPILYCVLFSALVLYLGLTTMIMFLHDLEKRSAAMEREFMDRVEKVVQDRLQQACPSPQRLASSTRQGPLNTKNTFDTSTVSDLASQMTAIPSHEFIKTIDLGIPMDVEYTKDQESSPNVLLMYGPKVKSPPPKTNRSLSATNVIPLSSSANKALESCQELVVFPVQNQKSCLAIVPYQSHNYYSQKWMRISKVKEKGRYSFEKGQPLRHVGMNVKENAVDVNHPPSATHSRDAFDILQNYLGLMKEGLQEIEALVKEDRLVPIDRGNGKGVITVMVCNFGQSEIIMNFACNAKAKGLDLSSILVFAADKEAYDLATSLGLTGYYNEKLFGKVPVKAAKAYGDRTFMALMTMKVISVHLISQLGYDLLFQDADVVWFRHPVNDYFAEEARWNDEYDIIFQEDGARSMRFAPYDANSGFYFVNNNERTQQLLNSVLLSMPSIVSSKSHQKVLINALNENALAYGLRAKVISRESPDLPCGYQWHRKPKLIQSFLSGRVKPIIFHMSWTENKDNKIKFFQQMGEWYVNDQCIGKTLNDIQSPSGTSSEQDVASLSEACCSSSPNFQCHYRDKPSLHDCSTSPALDQPNPSRTTQEEGRATRGKHPNGK